jgi:MFS family permease
LSTLLTHAIAPSLGEEIVRRFGFDTLFAITTAYTGIALLLATALPAGVAAPQGTATAAIRLSPLLWVIAVTTGLAGMGFGCVMTFIPTFVHEANLGRVAFFFAAYTSTAILSRIVGAGLSDSVGRHRVIVPTLLTLAASILLLSRADTIPMLVFAGMLFGCAQGIAYPTLHAFLVDQSNAAHLGRSQALFNGAFNLGVTISSFAFGVIAHHAGYRQMFALASMTPALACAVFYVFARTPPVAPGSVPLYDVEHP